MSESLMVSYEVEGVVAVITVNNPPVNALTPEMRGSIIDAVAHANADPAVAAIVLMGGGQDFIAGADIRQFGKARTITTRMSAAALDASAKPTVAAIHGYALGGGLGARPRLPLPDCIARSQARIARGRSRVDTGRRRYAALAEAGRGCRSHRFARLKPPCPCRRSIEDRAYLPDCSGTQSQELRDAAVSYAKAVAQAQPQRVRDLVLEPMDATTMDVLQAARREAAKKSPHNKAPQYAIDCIEAAFSLSFDEALEVEEPLVF